MRRLHAFSLTAFLTLLTACAPVTSTLPPEEPIFFSARYDALFDAALQEMTSTYVRSGGARVTFAITEADRDTGLITAVRNEPGPRTSVSLRSGRYRDVDEDDLEDSVFFGPFFRVYVPVPVRGPERTVVSAVLRPTERGATLVYSSTGPSARNAERYMAAVVEDLRERFPPPRVAPSNAEDSGMEPLEPTAPQNP